MQHPGDFTHSPGHFIVRAIHPKPRQAEVPPHLPELVAKTFKEACAILLASPTGACALFRKALELGLKDLSPDIDAFKLEKRIDRMAAEGKLTPALRDWAHRLRLDGNDAIHGMGDTTTEEALELQSLTKFVLTYLYTLPHSIREAQERKA